MISTIHLMIQKLLHHTYVLRAGMFIPLNRLTERYAKHIPETVMVEYIHGYINSGGTFIDIGAHIGMVACRVADHFDTVVAFEPIPQHAAIMSQICHANNITNVDIHIAALGAQHTQHRMSRQAGSSRMSESGSVVCTVVPLDSYEFDDVRCIKIDVEGYEWEVIKGARDTIEDHHPMIIFERSGHNEYDYDNIQKFLISSGYTRLQWMDNSEYWIHER